MHAKSSIIQTRVNYHAFECSCVPLWSEPVCSGVCVAVSLVLSLVFYESAMHTPWYLVAQYFSIAIFYDRSPPFLYEVAIENARLKNAARK